MILASKANVWSKHKSHEMTSVFMLFPSWAEVDFFCCEPDFPWNLITFVTVLHTRGQRRWSFMCWVFIRERSQDKHTVKRWGRNPCTRETRLHLSRQQALAKHTHELDQGGWQECSRPKEEKKRAGLKLNMQKTKNMASDPITSWQIDGETVANFIFWDSRIIAYGDCSHEIKMLTPWQESFDQPR